MKRAPPMGWASYTGKEQGMVETGKGRESAREIHDKRYGAYARTGAEDFFVRLRDAILEEYRGQGFCELVDEYLFRKYPQIELVVYCAILQMSAFSLYQKGQSSWMPCPGMPEQYSWEMFAKARSYLPVGVNILNGLHEANRAGRRRHLEYLKKREGVGGKDVEAKRESSEKTDKMTAMPEELVKKYLSERQRDHRATCERELAPLLDKNRETLDRAEKIHDRICAETSKLQVSWMRELTAATERLEGLKKEFYSHLRAWQQDLYPHEYGQLAERYIELYRIVDVDGLIAEQILALERDAESGGRDVKDRKRTAPWHGEEPAGGTERRQKSGEASEVVERLQKLQETLRVFLYKFEVSLNGLGLYVYRVKEGDPFDEVWHMDVGEGAECSGKKVKECLVPGIARKVIDEGEDDVIIPALVSVQG